MFSPACTACAPSDCQSFWPISRPASRPGLLQVAQMQTHYKIMDWFALPLMLFGKVLRHGCAIIALPRIEALG